MFVFGSISGKFHVKNALFNNKSLLITDYNNLKAINYNDFLLINDFEILISIPKNPKSVFGSSCYFYSKNYGIISSFPLWDKADKVIKKMAKNDIPCGTLDKPFNELMQGWQILIFKKRDFIYVLQGKEPCCQEFQIWYKVKDENYYNQWQKVIRVLNKQ